MKRLILIVFILISLIGTAQTYDKVIESTDTTIVGGVFNYNDSIIDMNDITFHQFSSDSINWHKDYQITDSYWRFSNDNQNTWYARAFATTVDLSAYFDSVQVKALPISTFTNDAGYLTDNQSITLSGAINGTGSTSISTTLGNDVVYETNLFATNSPTDGYFPSYDSGSGGFTWEAISSGSSLWSESGSDIYRNSKVGIGISLPEYKFVVMDSTEGDYAVFVENKAFTGGGLRIKASELTGYPLQIENNADDILFSVNSSGQLYAPSLPNISRGYVLNYDETSGQVGYQAAGAGSSTFIGNSDTPSSYSGQSGKLVRVNTGETGLEFVDPTSGSSLWTDGGTYVYPTGLENIYLPSNKVISFRNSTANVSGDNIMSIASAANQIRWIAGSSSVEAASLYNAGTLGLSYFSVKGQISANLGNSSTYESNNYSILNLSANGYTKFQFSGAGTIQAKEQAAGSTPTPSSGYGNWIVGDDGKPYFKNDAGTLYDLSTGTGSSGVSSVSSATTDQLTVANPTTTPSLTIITNPVTSSSTSLATGSQISSYVANNTVNSAIAGNLIDVSAATGDVTFAVDLSELTTDATATTSDYIPWIDATAGQKKMQLSTLESLIGGGGGSTDYVSNVALSGTDLVFTGVGNAFNSSVDLSGLGGGGGDMYKSTYDPANISEQLVGLTASQTLTNKSGSNSQWTNDEGYVKGYSSTVNIPFLSSSTQLSATNLNVNTSTYAISNTSTGSNSFTVNTTATPILNLINTSSSGLGLSIRAGGTNSNILALNDYSNTPRFSFNGIGEAYIGAALGVGTTNDPDDAVTISTNRTNGVYINHTGLTTTGFALRASTSYAADAGFFINLGGTSQLHYGISANADNTTYGIGAEFVGGRSAIRVNLNTAPSSSSDAGYTGEIRFTADYIYVCTNGDGPGGGTDTWKRVTLSTW